MIRKEFRNVLFIYLFTWLAVFLLVVIAALVRGQELGDAVSTFAEIAVYKSFLIFTHIFFGIFYGIFLLVRYFRRINSRKGSKIMLKRLALRLLLPVVLLFGGYKLLMSHNLSESYDYIWDDSVENIKGYSKKLYNLDGKHRGLSVFGWQINELQNTNAVQEIVRTNTEWVAITPFIYQKDERTKQIVTPENAEVWSRRDSTFIKAIIDLKDKGIQIQLKPHLWMSSGWRSNVNFDSSKDWDTWFDTYRTNMLRYARMAEETDVELYCVGTELKSSLLNKPEAWTQLVKEIKEIYHGKLTYAANWDGEFENVPFWDDMDYIGIQAYFPLTENANPSLEEIQLGWKEHVAFLEKLSQKHQKPILFTEVGYKSETTATIKPWEWNSVGGLISHKKSFETQNLAYEALFKELWNKEWFAGLYIWQWNIHSTEERARDNLDFSIRFKPSENTVSKWFGTPGAKIE